MNDRKLLELAAKAAGIEFDFCRPELGRDSFVTYDVEYYSDVKERRVVGEKTLDWNPLSNDGDALRLAVKLRIGIEINERRIVASWVDGGYEPSYVYEHPNSIQDHDFHIVYVNHDKATRRAIVRAAAEIGRQMQKGSAA